MQKTRHLLSEWVRKKGTGNTATAHLIQFTYRFFANSYMQAAVSILGTVVIAVMIGKTYYGFWFWIAVVLYIITTLLIAWANEHVRDKIKDTKIFQNSLYGMGATLRCIAVNLQKCAKQLKKADDLSATKQVIDSSNIDFQTAAFIVCEQLRDRLSQKDEKDDVYVTVFQKIVDQRGSYCRMIAHSAKHEVTSYGKTYPIYPEHVDCFGNVEYHTYVFAKGIKSVTTFHTQDLVKEAFCFHENCVDRENQIQQYICIPISPANLDVTFLLQVDTNEQGFFGMSKKAVDDFAENTIYPYAQALLMAYEQSRVIAQLTSK